MNIFWDLGKCESFPEFRICSHCYKVLKYEIQLEMVTEINQITNYCNNLKKASQILCKNNHFYENVLPNVENMKNLWFCYVYTIK